jgi:hypothetical protein
VALCGGYVQLGPASVATAEVGVENKAHFDLPSQNLFKCIPEEASTISGDGFGCIAESDKISV